MYFLFGCNGLLDDSNTYVQHVYVRSFIVGLSVHVHVFSKASHFFCPANLQQKIVQDNHFANFEF